MFFEEIQFWHWWIAALLFVLAEVFAPGAVLVWLGAASAVVGLILLVFPETSWQMQFLIWGVLSVTSVVLSRHYLRKHPIETDRPTLNRRGEQYLGRQFTLDEPVINGLGKIRVDDSTWKIESETDMPAGTRITVVGIEGTIFKVTEA
ncbi:MAG: NfeD family protein [Kiloniellales bacterium]|nr:NfeD family protein [Kiloniellales bacterium]